jgi:hypothetical protein
MWRDARLRLCRFAAANNFVAGTGAEFQFVGLKSRRNISECAVVAAPNIFTRILSDARSSTSAAYSRIAWRVRLIAMAHNGGALRSSDTI